MKVKIDIEIVILRLWCSRKYPYPSQRRFFKLNPHPSRNTILVSETCLSFGISINLPWGGHGYFLELHIILGMALLWRHEFNTRNGFHPARWDHQILPTQANSRGACLKAIWNSRFCQLRGSSVLNQFILWNAMNNIYTLSVHTSMQPFPRMYITMATFVEKGISEWGMLVNYMT